MTDLPIQCVTCGVERDADRVPEVCPICADERQYVPRDGQGWTRPGPEAHPEARIELVELEPGLHRLDSHGAVGIGQRPVLVQTGSGNVLVEAPTHIDDDAVAAVRALGGLHGIIASHPHMYGIQSLWAAEFDCPVHISRADEHWLGVRPARTNVWEGELELADGLVASQPGGHFPGSAVVHWRGRDGAGVLLCGDTIGPVRAEGWVTFMRSYPNDIPLSAAVVERIAAHVARYSFERCYGNFGTGIERGADAAVQRSARRYIEWVSGANDHLT